MTQICDRMVPALPHSMASFVHLTEGAALRALPLRLGRPCRHESIGLAEGQQIS